jgi:hypothetical protein
MNRPLLCYMALVATAATWPVMVYAQTTIRSTAPAVTKAKPEAQRISRRRNGALANALRSTI